MGFIINPYQFGVAFTGILDTYSGAAAAYSAARRLATAYTGSLIRVRRSSDNAEQDIGYDSNNVLDESALTTFVGAGNGFVTTWYDQSGNGKNATQSTANKQPQIVTSGVVNKKNSKPCINYNGTSHIINTSSISWNNSFTFTGVFDAIKTGDYSRLYDIDSAGLSGTYNFLTFAQNAFSDWQVDDALIFGNGYSSNNYPRIISNGKIFDDNIQYLTFVSLNSLSSIMYKNNTEISYRIQQAGNSTAASLPIYLGGNSSNIQYFKGNMQEIIFYASNKSSDRSGINSNINTFYSIY